MDQGLDDGLKNLNDEEIDKLVKSIQIGNSIVEHHQEKIRKALQKGQLATSLDKISDNLLKISESVSKILPQRLMGESFTSSYEKLLLDHKKIADSIRGVGIVNPNIKIAPFENIFQVLVDQTSLDRKTMGYEEDIRITMEAIEKVGEYSENNISRAKPVTQDEFIAFRREIIEKIEKISTPGLRKILMDILNIITFILTISTSGIQEIPDNTIALTDEREKIEVIVSDSSNTGYSENFETWIALTDVNIRASASTNSEILGVIKKSGRVISIDELDDWLLIIKISVDENEESILGYTSKNYYTKVDEEE